MIKIIDYGLGNVYAFKTIYDRLNIACSIARTAEDVADATSLILPGVGAFDRAMGRFNASGMRGVVEDLVGQNGVPVLGICVGMQIMAERSEEGEASGLGWIDADVRLLDTDGIRSKPKLPHMGWNTIVQRRYSLLFDGIDESRGFYHLHSYRLCCRRSEEVLAATEYGSSFTSVVRRGNIYGVQFHPEKSHGNGVRVLENFARMSTC